MLFNIENVINVKIDTNNSKLINVLKSIIQMYEKHNIEKW